MSYGSCTIVAPLPYGTRATVVIEQAFVGIWTNSVGRSQCGTFASPPSWWKNQSFKAIPCLMSIYCISNKCWWDVYYRDIVGMVDITEKGLLSPGIYSHISIRSGDNKRNKMFLKLSHACVAICMTVAELTNQCLAKWFNLLFFLLDIARRVRLSPSHPTVALRLLWCLRFRHQSGCDRP